MLRRTVSWRVDEHCWDGLFDEGVLRIYSAYERPLGIGHNPAVMAIDLYNLVFQGGALPPEELQEEYPSSCGKYAHAAIEPIRAVLAGARKFDVPVFHLTAGSGASATNRNKGVSDAQDVWDFHDAARPIEGEIVMRKSRASAFYGTMVLPELVRRGIDTLIVVGETTSGCVRASVVDGFTNGFHMVVVEDAVFDRSWLNHQVNLFDLHHKYADVLRVDTVLGLLGEEPVIPGDREEQAIAP